MTDDAELLGKVFELTRGDLDAAVFPRPQLGSVAAGMTFVRVRRLARFWDARGGAGEGTSAVPLGRCVTDLVTGLHGLEAPWMALIAGERRSIEYWFGVGRRAVTDAASLTSLLCGAYPDARYDGSRQPRAANFSGLDHALVLTGTPGGCGDKNEGEGDDRIEKLCRGLFGARWLYAVYARPVPAAETTAAINDVTEGVRNARVAYMLKTSAVDEQNRLAQRYVELLEADLRRLERGRVTGMWETRTILLADEAATAGRARSLLHSAFGGADSLPDPVRVRPCDPSARGGPAVRPLTSQEAASLARPPREEYPGFEVTEYARFGVEGSDRGSGGAAAVAVGDILDRGTETGTRFVVPRDDLTRHGLVAGVTGSGKTNTCFALLDQVWDAGSGVPFLVIESAKSEYRHLLKHPRFRGLKVFTVGDETISPLRFNPFEVPPGVLLQAHVDYLKSLFQAAFVLYPPMPYVLEQSLQEIYEVRGWDLARNANGRGEDSPRRFPTLADLEQRVVSVVGRMGYDERVTMDVRAGLLARIRQLRIGGGKGLMLSTRRSTDLSVLFESPCVLELKQLVSDDEKAFVMGLLLIRLYEYCESHPGRRAGGALRHLTLIEEAHRLLRNVSTEQGGEVAANPKGRAIEVFANILSEIRAYGEGIIIAEQIPVKLTPDAIKNTNLKVVHRLVSEDDRRALGATMNLGEAQSRYLATLGPGEAAVFAEGMRKPALLRVELSSAKTGANQVEALELREHMADFWRRNPPLSAPGHSCEGCREAAAGRPCGSGDAREADAPMLHAFRRLFNAIRLGHRFVRESYDDFEARRRGRHAHHAAAPGSSHCFFAGLAELEVESRGEVGAWAHRDVDRAVTQVCAVMTTIGGLTVDGTDEGLKRELRSRLSEAGATLTALHRRATPPFAGCRPCAQPCQYGLDMALPPDDPSAQDFREAFRSPSTGNDDLARHCWDSTLDFFNRGDVESRRGAALCFAAQQLHALGISRSAQEASADAIALALAAVDI